jgi:hypothetical protein
MRIADGRYVLVFACFDLSYWFIVRKIADMVVCCSIPFEYVAFVVTTNGDELRALVNFKPVDACRYALLNFLNQSIQSVSNVRKETCTSLETLTSELLPGAIGDL